MNTQAIGCAAIKNDITGSRGDHNRIVNACLRSPTSHTINHDVISGINGVINCYADRASGKRTEISRACIDKATHRRTSRTGAAKGII